MFTTEELNKGLYWVKNNNYYEQLKQYDLSLENINEKKLKSLDEFQLYEIPEISEDNYYEIEIIIQKNIEFKYDLEYEIRTESCNRLSYYIYELIEYIQKQ